MLNFTILDDRIQFMCQIGKTSLQVMYTSCTYLHSEVVVFNNYVESQTRISYYDLQRFMLVELLLPSSVAYWLQSLSVNS
jgi:hypothetical protein